MKNSIALIPHSPFAQFAKGLTLDKVKTNECVIYTRVSDIKQVDNLSLEVQLKYSTQYAEQKGLVVRAIFGGTHESAKTDERKEFQRMLDFVQTTKHQISYILVYSLERFSRSENSIWLVTQLRKLGIEIISVTQPIDTSNPSGQMQQKMLFLFGEHDNLLRRQKCMAGTKERLLKGEWCNKAPVGYDHIRVNGERKIVVNEKGKLIRKAFYWKLEEDSSLEEIRLRLAKQGLKMSLGHVGETLRNPFYCGILVHSALEGQVVEGKHEKLISKEVFLRVNNLHKNNHPSGYQQKEENELIPLKRFLKCSTCNEPMRGYIVRQWNIPYYKCNTPGCNNNRNGHKIHAQFESILGQYTVNSTLKPLIKEQLGDTLKSILKGHQENKEVWERKREELVKKMERLEERFVMEEITAELYQKYLPKLQEEKVQVEEQLAKTQIGVSKWEDAVEIIAELCCNLSKTWQQSNYSNKQKLQYLVFPKGMEYDRKNDLCRSEEVNPVFSYIAEVTRGLSNKKMEALNKNEEIPVGSS